MNRLAVLPLPDEVATRWLGARLLPLLAAGDAVALAGDLGAGKTTLARGLIQAAVGNDQPVPSPTFTLVQEYECADRPAIRHFDLYRLTDPEELVELGWQEALAGGIALVEWPERAEAVLPAETLWLRLIDCGEGRTAVFEGGRDWGMRLQGLGLEGLGLGRDTAIRRFLARHRFAAAFPAKPSADASFRRYIRLTDGPYPALLMDAPPEKEPLRPFIEIAAHLRSLGLAAPEIPAHDLAQGFALVEDFGDATFTRLLDGGSDPSTLYARAVDALIALHRHPGNAAIDVPAYDLTLLSNEARLFTEWYWPAVQGTPPSPAVEEKYAKLCTGMLTPLLDMPGVLVHRDFHVDNLMFLQGREGVRACGLLDFQDAAIGHPAYDLASLLQDARRDTSPALVRNMCARYAAALPHLWHERAYWTLAAQRHLKVLGIFTRLAHRDDKPGYLRHTARLWRLLGKCFAAEPTLAPLRAFLDEHWPSARRIPPEPPVAKSGNHTRS